MNEPIRKLAAVLAADVAGYSRLMSEDDAGALAVLRRLRDETFEPVVSAHRGNIIKRMGDGWLVTFESVADAVNCAVAVQDALKTDEKIRLRMGLHIGDITHENEDIFGDGVNIATRLQELADPGSIVISDDVRRQVNGKVKAEFASAGTRKLKNIAEPIVIYSLGSVQADAAIVSTPALPKKPSIAVLPFDDMSEDGEQEYFVDGMTEDIITQLAKLRWLFVIARNSSFHYKGTAPDVRQVGQELGVRYVLEGSIRKLGNRLRVTAQLIDATDGSHIWAERFDRELKDIFELQDELTQAIATNVNTELASQERVIARHKDETDLNAWDCYQRGMWHAYQSGKDNIAQARVWFHKSRDADPNFAQAHGALAYLNFLEVGMGYVDDPAAALQDGFNSAKQALILDEKDAFHHMILGRLFTYMGDDDRAIRSLKHSIDLNSNSAQAYYGLGFHEYWYGRAESGLDYIDQAIRLSPHDPFLWSFHFFRASCLFAIKRRKEAVQDYEIAIELGKGEFWPYLGLASLYGIQGRLAEAQNNLAMAEGLRPGLTLETVTALVRNLHETNLKRLVNGLRHAGMPES
jgi:TolB-like protein/Flp pilus assembly protein TadD